MSIPTFPPLFIRFTHKSPEHLDSYIAFIKSLKLKQMTALETGSETEKEHVHTILHIDCTIDAFRKKMHKKVEFKGNEECSIKIIKEEIEKVQRYTCKGERYGYSMENPNMLLIINYSQNDIKTYHNEYWERNKEIKQENIIKNKKKEKALTWTQEVVYEFYNKNPELVSVMDYSNSAHKRAILEFVLKRYGAFDKGFDGVIIRKACNAIWNKIAPTRFVDSIFRQVYPEDYDRYEQYVA